MASIKDVAEKAGVSASTVSYVLNRKRTVRPETYRKILVAIDEVNYHPNIAARSLKTNESKSIGVAVADLTNIFYIDLLSGIENRMARAGYSVIVTNSRNSAEMEKENLLNLIYRNIDGIILLGTGNDISSMTENFTMPVISTDRIDHEWVYTVSLDNVKGGRIGTNYLLQKGRGRIAFIGFSNQVSSRDRYQGCLDAYAEYGVDSSENFIYVETSITPEGGYESTIKLFTEKSFGKIEAVFAGADYIALGVLKALSDLGVAVPGDVSVVGFDDLLISRYCVPALTTIRQPRYEMGMKSAEMLLKLLAHEKVDTRLRFEPSLIIRESS
jgi:DNA-binding LacI/PurR family transcriptional regulator